MSAYFEKRIAEWKAIRAARELAEQEEQKRQHEEWCRYRDSQKHPSPEEIEKWSKDRQKEMADRQARTRVYVFPAREYVKIGVTWNPKKRWQAIRNGNPLLEEPAYVSLILWDRAWAVEKESHFRLNEFRVDYTEWFKCDRELAVETVKAVIAETAPGVSQQSA